MKKGIFLAFILLALVACQDQVQQLSGTYSYKISGQAIVDGDTVGLLNEVGAMDILRVSSESAIFTFNALTGPAYYATAHFVGKTILFGGYQRTINVGTKEYTVQGEAEGKAYDETLLFTLRYYNEDQTFVADSLILLCKKN